MNFEAKDWLIMIIPIALEGIIIFFFQTYINQRLKRFEKKLAFKENIIHTFLIKIMDIRLEYEKVFHRGKETSENEIQILLNQILSSLNYFNANKGDLDEFAEEFYLFYNSWTNFVDLWNYNSGKMLETEMRSRIERQLNICAKNTDSLIKKIRDKEF